MFHFGIQGLIVGSEANSDTAGLSQAVHFFILQCLFTFAVFFVWPHNVSNLSLAMFCMHELHLLYELYLHELHLHELHLHELHLHELHLHELHPHELHLHELH